VNVRRAFLRGRFGGKKIKPPDRWHDLGVAVTSAGILARLSPSTAATALNLLRRERDGWKAEIEILTYLRRSRCAAQSTIELMDVAIGVLEVAARLVDIENGTAPEPSKPKLEIVR
jgi:hypothetical protein